MKESKDCKSCSSRKNGVLNCVGDGVLEMISEEKCFYKFKKKEYIFHEEEKANGFYCLKSGSVRTFKVGTNGKEQTFQIEGKGKWLGFRDMISSETFNHDVVCLEDTEVCFIRKDLVSRLIKSDEKFQLEVMKYLATEWKEAENQMYSMSTKQSFTRLADLILTFQKTANNSDEFQISVTREVMATCIGITTEALIRALSELKQKGYLDMDKNNFKILNKDALVELAST